MFSLQQFLSKDDRFFDLLEASANQAHLSVEVLNAILAAPLKVPNLGDFRQAKETGKQINNQINESLAKCFVTHLE